MIQALKNNIALLIAGLLLAFSAVIAVNVAVPSLAGAEANIQGSLCKGANDLEVTASGGSTAECTQARGQTASGFNNLLTKIINVFTVVVGVVAVIMIIVGGFRYITSGGDSNNVGAAKNTILYAIVGLIIVALAQVIVRFVLGATTTV